MELGGGGEVCFPAVPVGRGTVKMSHGVLPVPAPATARLLEGFEIYGGGDGEMTTPTGAAIVTTLGTQVLQLPRLTTHSIGYGAGSREVEGRPNVLRVMVGVSSSHSAAEGDTVCLLSCQLDDMTGEEHGFLAEQLWSGGALDVGFIPIYMKCGRRGV